jgi:hypothetical protein
MLSSALKKEGRFIPEDIRKKAFQKAWVVYGRPPAKGVNQVVEYIARYAFRAAITNSRIINVTDDGKVTFDYKDYRYGGMHKSKTVKAVDFLMLLAQHILPQGFFRIRHYGILPLAVTSSGKCSRRWEAPRFRKSEAKSLGCRFAPSTDGKSEYALTADARRLLSQP